MQKGGVECGRKELSVEGGFSAEGVGLSVEGRS